MSIIPNNNLQAFVLITMGKRSLHFLMRKLLFTTDGNQYKTKINQRPLQKMTINQNVELLSPFPNNRYTKYSRKNAQARGVQKSWKSQRISEFAVRLCLLATSGATPIKAHQHDFPNLSCIRMTPMDMPNWTEKSSEL